MKRRPRHSSLLLVILLLLTPLASAQVSMLETNFYNKTNFTQCNNLDTATVYLSDRHYDRDTNTFRFNISAHTSIAVTDLSQGQDTYSASRTEVVLGFNAVMDQRQRLCPDLADSGNGCPIPANSNVTIQQSFSLPNTSLPLGDIITRYTAYTASGDQWICLTMAPIGYENPTWEAVFIYVPVAFVVFAAFVSFFASFATVSEAEHDVFLFTSNYAMLPAALRLKSPGFFDLIYHAQFIVLTGMLNLDYPKFYQLFASNFAWSFLLFPVDWMRDVHNNIFPYTAPKTSDEEVPVEVAGHGITNYASAVDIDVNNLFLTSFVFMLIILAGCLLLCFSIWMVVQVMSWRAPHRYAAQTPKIANFTLGILLRVLTLFYLPMMALGFFQLMLPAPWYLLLTAALVLVFHICMIYGAIAFILLGVRPSSLVFSDITLLLRYGCLYNTFTDDHSYFFLCGLVYRIFIGAMAGWFSVSEVAQIVVLLFFEVGYFALHIFRRPYASTHVNFQHMVFGGFRVVIMILNIAYVHDLEVLDRDKQAIAYTQIVLHCFVFLLMFAFPIRNLVVLLTGLADDELYEAGAPPARMAIWRRKRPFGRREVRQRVPTNDDLERFTTLQQEYQQKQHEPVMEAITLHDDPAPPSTFMANPTTSTTKSPRSSLPPPPPPPHRVLTTNERKPAIENHKGWKVAGKNRTSILGINPNTSAYPREESSAPVTEPLMTKTDRHSSWTPGQRPYSLQ